MNDLLTTSSSKTPFVPSPYQQAVFDWTARGHGSAIVTAVPGSGKTTTMVKAMAFMPKHYRSIKLLAFNAAIAKELQERLAEEEFVKDLRARGLDPANFSASTFNSLGFGVVRKHLERLGVRNVKTDADKLRHLAKAMFLPHDPSGYETYADFAIKLVNLAKGDGIGTLSPDTPATWTRLIEHHDLYMDVEGADETIGVEYARDLLRRSNETARTGFLDFNDQLYLVLLWKLRPWQNDFLGVDEAQDVNPVKLALMRLALRPGGNLLAVGDRMQAINGFTGASVNALDEIKEKFDAIELPLTVSYRCSQAVVRNAQAIVPYLEAFAGAPEGSVQTLKLNDALSLLTERDAILCRQTAPLVKLAYALIARGIGCRVLGKEIGVGLVNLVKRTRARGIDHLVEKLIAYRDRETEKLRAQDKESQAAALEDRVACVLTVADSLPEGGKRTVPALLTALEDLFGGTDQRLILSTGHKSKGREWETVAILEPELMPSKYAKQDWQRFQEQCLLNVVNTRAKLNLIYLQTERKDA